MIIFINEETAYRSWLTRHREGFVLDGLRKPTRRVLVLHRASCGEIRRSKSKRSHFTTGRHFKACSPDPQELLEWAEAEAAQSPEYCLECAPQVELNRAELVDRGLVDEHLTKLDREILDNVLDVAVLHLDRTEASDYAYTVGDLALSLGKTPAQIATAFWRLIQSGQLQIEGKHSTASSPPAAWIVYPTAKSLRATAAFEHEEEPSIAAELRRLLPR